MNPGKLLSFFCILLVGSVLAESPRESAADHDARMAWWREAKFGMFIHLGIYSITGGEYKGQSLPNSAEWMMNRGKVPIADYERYAAQFNPAGFDADVFVRLAKEAGMKYIVITAKHHDGFSMFASKASQYDVVDATPFKRDIMKELSVACQKQGIRFGFYYSQAQDWHHPGGFGNNWDKTIKRVSSDVYVDEKVVPEVKQLLTEYGPISIFWWDTPREMSKTALDLLYSTRELQPGLITNDRLGEGYPGDHQTFERNIPSQGPDHPDWEVCMPISGSWGFKRGDTNFKSASTLIRNLADIASKGGNYLLNVSPTGDGTLLLQAVDRLHAVGAWMKVNGESIYGTTASPFGRLAWGRSTTKKTGDDTTVYLHVFDWPKERELLVPGLKNSVVTSRLLADGTAVRTRQTADGLILTLPAEAPDKINSVVAVTVRGELDVAPVSPMLQKDGSLELTPQFAFLHNNEGARAIRMQESDGVPFLGSWTDVHAWVEWPVKVNRPGRYEVRVEFALEGEGASFSVGLPGQQQRVEVTSTGGHQRYAVKSLGTVTFDQAGSFSFRINPDAMHWQPVNLRRVVLRAE